MRARIAGDGHVRNARGLGIGEARRRRLHRQAGPMFDAIESFLFDGHGQFAIQQKGGGGISMVGVQA